MNRFDILEDITLRLRQHRLIGCTVERSRVGPLDAGDLPRICVYSMAEQSLQRFGPAPTYRTEVTVAIEVRVTFADGWDRAALDLTEAIKTALFTDGAWTARWQQAPEWNVQAFQDAKGDRPVIGEILSLRLVPRSTVSYEPSGDLLEGVDVDVVDSADRVLASTKQDMPEG